MPTPTIEVCCSRCGQPLLIPKTAAALTVKCPKCEIPLQISSDGKVRRRSDDEFANVPAVAAPDQAPRRAKGFTPSQPAAMSIPDPATPQPGRVYMPMEVKTQAASQNDVLVKRLIGLTIASICVVALAVVAIQFLPADLPERMTDNALVKALPDRFVPTVNRGGPTRQYAEAIATIQQAFDLQVEGFQKLPTADGGSNYTIRSTTVDQIAAVWKRSAVISKQAIPIAANLEPLTPREFAEFEKSVESWSNLEQRYLDGRPWRTTYPMLRGHWFECQSAFQAAIAGVAEQIKPDPTGGE